MVAVSVLFSMSASVFADGEWNYAVEVFIRGLYQGCLEREADEAGLSYWYGKITSGEVTGKQAAYGFFYSQEFLRSLPMMTEDQVITRYYNVFLGRYPDQGGLDYWTEMLHSGGGPDELFAGFADSQEFLARCWGAGIDAGSHLDVPNVTSYWGPYSTAFNLLRLRGCTIDDAAVIGSIVDQCNYWTGLEYSGSPDSLHYQLGGKNLIPGYGIDCSGFVTAIYKRALGTQTFTSGEAYSASIYTSSQVNRGSWAAGTDRCPPMTEGVYSTIGDFGRPVYTDRYGISTAYAMNTFQWHLYLNAIGMTGNSFLTWHVGDYDQEQITAVLDSRGFKPGDIVLWYSSVVDAPHSEHIGIYAGNGQVWHCTSMLSDGAQLSPITYMGSYADSVIQYCRIYHMT